MLQIKNFQSSIAGKDVLKGVNLSIKKGEVHAVMGPNGAGKTTLVMSLMGNPGSQFRIQNSEFRIDGEDVQMMSPEEKAKKGLFVAFQSPIEITGVSVLAFLRTSYKALYPDKKISLSDFKKKVRDALKVVNLDESFMHRSVNEGFSGGEKKRCEIVQLIVLNPRYAILDEIDSGLDVDSLRVVAKAIEGIVKKKKTGVLLITHYQRILHYLKPDYVHVLVDGVIKKSGGLGLVRKIEKEGYAAV